MLFQIFYVSLFSLACFVKHFGGEIVLAPRSSLRCNSHMVSNIFGAEIKHMRLSCYLGHISSLCECFSLHFFYNNFMDSKVVPLLSPFKYFEWKSNMCAYIKRHCLYDVSIGAMREPDSYQEKYDWLNDNDRAYGTMCLAIPPTMRYLLDFVDYPFELWRI